MTTTALWRALSAAFLFFHVGFSVYAQEAAVRPSSTQVIEISPESPSDPLGIWDPDDIQPVPSDEQQARAIKPLTKPSIHVYTFSTPQGQVIVSQLWNESCSTTLCPTRQVLVKPDGTRETQLDDMLPQVEPDVSRALSSTPEFSLAPDGTLIQRGVGAEERALRPSGETAESLIAAGMPKVCAPFGARVSQHEGRFQTRSTKNCLGAFQFCPGTFERFYSGTASNFLNDPRAQVAAWTRYEREQWSMANKSKLTSLIGTNVCYDGKCKKVDQSAILMACQFGCGRTGKLAHFVQGRNCEARNVKDGFGTSVCGYLVSGAGFDVSCFTGTAPVNGPAVGGQVGGPTTTGGPSASVCPAPIASNPAAGDLEIVDGGFSLKYRGNVSMDTLQTLLSFMKARSGATTPP